MNELNKFKVTYSNKAVAYMFDFNLRNLIQYFVISNRLFGAAMPKSIEQCK